MYCQDTDAHSSIGHDSALLHTIEKNDTISNTLNNNKEVKNHLIATIVVRLAARNQFDTLSILYLTLTLLAVYWESTAHASLSNWR